jgi:hypothetical protein
MRALTSSQIEYIEGFVRDNEEDAAPRLLARDIENTKTKYTYIKDHCVPYTYCVAATNPNGFAMYNLYKSSDNVIYLFTSYIDTLSSYYKVTDDWIISLKGV